MSLPFPARLPVKRADTGATSASPSDLTHSPYVDLRNVNYALTFLLLVGTFVLVLRSWGCPGSCRPGRLPRSLPPA